MRREVMKVKRKMKKSRSEERRKREREGRKRKNEKRKDEVCCMREREREIERVVVMLGLSKCVPHFSKYLQKCHCTMLLKN